jgi:putative acetyltransferase
MITTIRTDSENPYFIELVKLLDADLASKDGADHSFYAQYNKIDKIKYAVVAYIENIPVACGAIKQFTPESMEVKRMFTAPDQRGKGLATHILTELEK